MSAATLNTFSAIRNYNSDVYTRASTLPRNTINSNEQSSVVQAPRSNKTFSLAFNHGSYLSEKTVMSFCSQSVKPVPPKRTFSLLNNNTSSSEQLTRSFSFHRNTAVACTDNEVFKVESCYKSVGTKVIACKCLVDLYSTNIQNVLNLSDWTHENTGMPVWVFNTGVNPKRKKSLSFILADRQTGFAIRQIQSVTYLNEFKWVFNEQKTVFNKPNTPK